MLICADNRASIAERPFSRLNQRSNLLDARPSTVTFMSRCDVSSLAPTVLGLLLHDVSACTYALTRYPHPTSQ